MATIKVKPKQEVEPKDVAGRIIGALFLIMLLAGGYYLFDMFRTIEMTDSGIQGEWIIPADFGSSETECWQFTASGEGDNTGIARKYTRNMRNGTRTNEVEYDYSLEDYTDDQGNVRKHILVTTKNVRLSERETYEIRITSLSKIEMSVIFVYKNATTNVTRLTRPSIF